MIIGLEGIDGSGKSSHAKEFENWLNTFYIPMYNAKMHICRVAEPSNITKSGKLIREHLSKGTLTTAFSKKELIDLFNNDRQDFFSSQIDPWKNSLSTETQPIIVLDRSFVSTLAYQLNEDSYEALRLNVINNSPYKFDILFYLKTSPKVSLDRINLTRGPSNISEYENLEKLSKTASNYDNELLTENWKDYAESVFVIDTDSLSFIEVQQRIREIFVKRIQHGAKV